MTLSFSLDSISQNAFLFMLLFHWRCRNHGCISRDEWMDGMEMWRCNTLGDLRGKLVDLLGRTFKDRFLLREIYADSFAYCTDYQPGSPLGDLADAEDILEALLGHRPLTASFIQYMKTHSITSIPRDVWMEFFELSFVRKEDLPRRARLLEDFVEYILQQQQPQRHPFPSVSRHLVVPLTMPHSVEEVQSDGDVEGSPY